MLFSQSKYLLWRNNVARDHCKLETENVAIVIFTFKCLIIFRSKTSNCYSSPAKIHIVVKYFGIHWHAPYFAHVYRNEYICQMHVTK